MPRVQSGPINPQLCQHKPPRLCQWEFTFLSTRIHPGMPRRPHSKEGHTVSADATGRSCFLSTDPNRGGAKVELPGTFLPLEKCMFKNKAYASEAGSCRQDVREQWPQAWMQPCLKSNQGFRATGRIKVTLCQSYGQNSVSITCSC